MKNYQIKLSPVSPFSGFPSSDTLFGAICWGIKRIYNETKLATILENYQEKPEFILSSSFPYIECNNDIFFFPKPTSPGLSASDIYEMAKIKKEKVEIITKYKKFKKSEYFSFALFSRFLNNVSEKILFQEYLNDEVKLKGKLLMSKKELEGFNFVEKEPLLKSELVQKNAIDRLTMSTGEEGQTFYQEEYFASPAFKLHFLIKTDNIESFKPIFRYLEDKGIGGNRSVGKGRFKIETLNTISVGNDTACNFITLSRYIPDIAEINPESKSMFYAIFPYRSKVDSEAEFKGEDIWKSKVIYLKEGSCFEAKERKPFYGQCPVVKEIGGQKIRQYGFAFPVFGNIGGSK
ncbi:MAG: type III-A CRISPR-associated RAMP protein Csm4 [Candidatus Brocadia sp. AMX2]|uniref:CRISPR system Cms protein Csm4 n=1 Tax=Candidatus Brocadia sinica JPN1 TaxID=1197129 RepID=A0ABQ0JTJ6_9BACT|nr:MULTISPECIES: type III-A CRISPR-associated RAMP protein Csm4 [Brocadia]MBC6931977.1 type III-A CRISPR-associated RAMP protein Csm4 [Candidatus Brocadia sp.]MBL1168259.1 type III-A CRISPR-associated RAMP protein Csm4 [Candidatus Brocadia sp. AMX1]NOG39968.1 type III-A CRISPR-associated RAMP protein Csm4 [Planctomycetota bacterium]NUQ57673.1 type III-A CRISPR-associated RAMP protein Csm4 [Candidatus Paceibacter sp.]GIK12856.1 MAG: type III-A CRISPR-associated RAMP protein Csm4 [Candidatus Bro